MLDQGGAGLEACIKFWKSQPVLEIGGYTSEEDFTYKVYEKGMKSAKSPSIPYLDEVVEDILQLEHSGFTSEKQYDSVMSRLYE